jgi:hypothetical protein
MISEKGNRTLIWLNLILLVIVVSAFLTYIFLGKSDSSATIKTESVASTELLKKELGLSKEQYQKILVQNDRTFRNYDLVADMMCEVNVTMLEELSKPEPNVMVLDSLAHKYGVLTSSLRKRTIDYFMNLKGICTPEQQVKLTRIFKEIMDMDKQCATCNKKDCPRKERINNLGKD